MTRAQFETDFHSRTLAYLPGFRDDGRAVVVRIGADAHTRNGHALLITLVNLLARTHRRIVLVGSLRRPLLCADVFGQKTLEAATIGMARAINPFIEAEASDVLPADLLVVIGVGGVEAEIRLGSDGWCALIGPDARVDPRPPGIWGALFAAGLGAATAFHRLRGVTDDPSGSYSLWRPGTNDSGPAFNNPIDIGRALQVGAGAVGAALDYFLALVGIEGQWRIVDGDRVDVTNLNRQMLYVAADAGFPGGGAAFKAERAAAIMGSVASAGPTFYADDQVARGTKYDLVLALANDGGVRAQLQDRQPTLLLHATTGPAWEAFLHRHIAGRDDCIVCRIPEETEARFICSTGDVESGGARFDAALPFLSATSGLLLAAALVRLQLGVLADGEVNLWRVDMAGATPQSRGLVSSCSGECRRRLAPEVRSKIDQHSRFRQLDPEVRF